MIIIDGQRKKNVIIGGEYVHNFYISIPLVLEDDVGAIHNNFNK